MPRNGWVTAPPGPTRLAAQRNCSSMALLEAARVWMPRTLRGPDRATPPDCATPTVGAGPSTSSKTASIVSDSLVGTLFPSVTVPSMDRQQGGTVALPPDNPSSGD